MQNIRWMCANNYVFWCLYTHADNTRSSRLIVLRDLGKQEEYSRVWVIRSAVMEWSTSKIWSSFIINQAIWQQIHLQSAYRRGFSVLLLLRIRYMHILFFLIKSRAGKLKSWFCPSGYGDIYCERLRKFNFFFPWQCSNEISWMAGFDHSTKQKPWAWDTVISWEFWDASSWANGVGWLWGVSVVMEAAIPIVRALFVIDWGLEDVGLTAKSPNASQSWPRTLYNTAIRETEIQSATYLINKGSFAKILLPGYWCSVEEECINHDANNSLM